MKEIDNYEKAVEAIAAKFIKKYFDEGCEYYWIADDIGGIFHINDYFFNLNTMIVALQYKATPEQLFDYYDANLEIATMTKKPKKALFSFKNYVKYPDSFWIKWENDKLKWGVR